jgi:hypothetical protein
VLRTDRFTLHAMAEILKSSSDTRASRTGKMLS